VREGQRRTSLNRGHQGPKQGPPRSSPRAGSDPIAIALREIETELRKAAREFYRNSLRAKRASHPIEAAIYSRLASRFTSLGEFQQNQAEISELAAWLPLPAQHRSKTCLERKAWHVQFIRRLRLDGANESLLISSATQRPGRFPETRCVAVRALELHDTGRSWREIESSLLPHRRNARNPGRSICREVQFLKKVLARYQVKPENDAGPKQTP
jgi:hypothetical protein